MNFIKMIKKSELISIFRMTFIKLKYRKQRVIFGRKCNISGKCVFEGSNRIANGCTFIGKMGYGSYIGANSDIDAFVGRYSCIGPNVHTIRGKHPTRQFVSIHPAFYSTKAQSGFTYVNEDVFEETTAPTEIGNDVWIGANTLIVGDVKIGDGAIVAAGSVVTKDIPAYSIVGGVPAKLIRKRFNDNEILELLKIKWWNWDMKTIQERVSDFSNSGLFVEKYKDN